MQHASPRISHMQPPSHQSARSQYASPPRPSQDEPTSVAAPASPLLASHPPDGPPTHHEAFHTQPPEPHVPSLTQYSQTPRAAEALQPLELLSPAHVHASHGSASVPLPTRHLVQRPLHAEHALQPSMRPPQLGSVALSFPPPPRIEPAHPSDTTTTSSVDRLA